MPAALINVTKVHVHDEQIYFVHDKKANKNFQNNWTYDPTAW